MATSRPIRSARVLGAIAAAVTLLALPLLIVVTSSQGRAASGGARPASARPAGPFAWLAPAPPPAGWLRTTTATTRASLFYPPGWRSIPGDQGTVTVALADSHSPYAGYLNLTPRQGAERLQGWAAFGINRNRDEGDRRVRELAAALGLHFRDPRGACVIDQFLSKVGSHPYLEIACIVTGTTHTDVFIGAALQRDWPTLAGTLQRAASALLQR